MAAALSIVSGIWSLLSALWGNPFTRGLLIAAVAYGFGFHKGDQHGDKQCADARLRATIARQKVEIAIARDQAASATKTAAELDSLRVAAEKRLDELRAKLKTDPNAVYDSECRVVDPRGVRDKPKPKR